MRGRTVKSSELVLRPAKVKAGPRPRCCPFFLHAGVNPRQKWNDERVRAEKKTLLAVALDERVATHPLEVPAAAVEFDENNQIGRSGICRQRVDSKTVDLCTVLCLAQEREIE